MKITPKKTRSDGMRRRREPLGRSGGEMIRFDNSCNHRSQNSQVWHLSSGVSSFPDKQLNLLYHTSQTSEFEATLNSKAPLTKNTLRSFYHTSQMSAFETTENANLGRILK